MANGHTTWPCQQGMQQSNGRRDLAQYDEGNDNSYRSALSFWNSAAVSPWCQSPTGSLRQQRCYRPCLSQDLPPNFVLHRRVLKPNRPRKKRAAL